MKTSRQYIVTCSKEGKTFKNKILAASKGKAKSKFMKKHDVAFIDIRVRLYPYS